MVTWYFFLTSYLNDVIDTMQILQDSGCVPENFEHDCMPMQISRRRPGPIYKKLNLKRFLNRMDKASPVVHKSYRYAFYSFTRARPQCLKQGRILARGHYPGLDKTETRESMNLVFA